MSTENNGKCMDCIYAKPIIGAVTRQVLICGWNHKQNPADYECKIHSFFPKKKDIKTGETPEK